MDVQRDQEPAPLCAECGESNLTTRTKVLLTTKCDDMYIQDERNRIFHEFTVWLASGKKDLVSTDINETAHLKEYNSIPQKPTTHWEDTNMLPERDDNIKSRVGEVTFQDLSLDERFEVATAMAQVVSRPLTEYLMRTNGGDDDEDDNGEIYTSKYPFSYLYYAMLVREEEKAITRANEVYDRKRFWLLDTQVTFRKVYAAARVLGRDTLVRWLEGLINKKMYPDQFLDTPIYYCFTQNEQKQMVDRVDASETEFVCFLLALRVTQEKLLEYENLRNPSVKAVYYYVHEQPFTSINYVNEVAKRAYMKETIRNLYVFKPLWDVIKRNSEY